MEGSKNLIFKRLLLELMCYVPIALIIGNILPPFSTIKFHWIYIGFIFCLTVLILACNRRTISLLSILLLLIVAQLIVAIKFSITDFIDFVAGPLLFIVVVNILITDDIQIETIRRIRRNMLIGFMVPVIIASLQYIKILPLEFMNAKFVNATIYGEETIARVNGFLYHGIELAVIIFFLFVSIVISKSRNQAYIVLPLMILTEFITTIKTGIISALLFSGFFGYFIDHRLRFLKSVMVVVVAVLGFSYILTLIPDIQEQRFNFDTSSFRFEDQLFTGRGYIWNIYIQGIAHFNFLQVCFGGGFGSAPIIYEQHSIGWVSYSAGTHNQLLELIVTGGLFSIVLIYLIFKKQYQKLSQYFRGDKEFKAYFIGVMAIPLFTMGLTAPIMSMFVYWCGLSAVLLTFKLEFASRK